MGDTMFGVWSSLTIDRAVYRAAVDELEECVL